MAQALGFGRVTSLVFTALDILGLCRRLRNSAADASHASPSSTMTDAAPDDVTLEESGRSERGISAEDSMAAMKSQLKLMKSLHQASTFDLGSVRRRQPHATPRAPP